jgi:hypothetical protein
VPWLRVKRFGEYNCRGCRMAKGYMKRPPTLRPLVFRRALVRRERKEKPDKSSTFKEEFARIDDHRRPKLAHIACHQGSRARAGDRSSRTTTRLSDYVERYHGTRKAEYLSGRLKGLAEHSAIVGASKTVVMRHKEAKAGAGGPN